jgi:hypothetical protein
MKKLISNYSFNASGKTVTFSDYGSISLENVLLITNVTTNTVIYNFTQSAKGGTVSGNVLTLTYNTGSMSNGDKLQIYYDDPNYAPTQSTKITDGTNSVNVLKSDGTSAGQNSQLVSPSYLTVPFTTSTAQAVATTDVGNYRWVSVQVASQGTSSSVVFQVSNDGVNYTNVTLAISQTNISTVVSNTANTGIWHGPLTGRYFRLNVTGISAGTTAGTIVFSSMAGVLQAIGVDTEITNATASTDTLTNPTVGQVGVIPSLFNGTSWDRTRSATATAGTTGTGLLGTGVLGYDGTNYQRLKTDANGVLAMSMSDGTTTGSNIAGDAGQNAQLVAGSRKEVAFTTTTVQALAATDVSNYRWVSVHVVAQGTSSTITYQGSNDNTNWVNVVLQNTVSSGAFLPSATDTTTGVIRHGPLSYRYFRLNVTGISAGTTSGVIEFFSQSPATITNSGLVTQSGAWTVGSNTATGSATPANAFLMGMSDNTNLQPLRTNVGADAATGNIFLATQQGVYNGSNYDRVRTASSVAGTTGTGLVGAGVLGFDGTNYQRLKTDSSGVLAVSGTSSGGDIVTGDTGQNAGVVTGGRKEVTSLSAGSLNADLLSSTDASNYSWGSVQVTGTWSGTITFQVSNDNSTWNSMTWANSASTVSSSTSTTTGNAVFHGPIPGRYIRIRMTAYTSGTANGTVELFNNTRASNAVGVQAAQSGTWTVGSNTATGTTVPANAFYVGATDGVNLTGLRNVSGSSDGSTSALSVGGYAYNGTGWDRQRSANTAAGTTGTGLLGAGVLGIYNSAAPTITSGNYERIQLDVNGNQKETLATLIAGENLSTNRMMVEYTNSYTYISTATTTVVKSGAGFLHNITVQGGTTGTIIIYDNTAGSGTIIYSFDSTAAIATYAMDISFSTGCTVVTGAATKLTVAWH